MSTPRFLADENLRFAIVDAARRRDANVEFTTVQEHGLEGTPDDELLQFAADNGLITVTHDEKTMIDYAARRIRAGRAMTGLLVVPQDRPNQPVAESLVLVAAGSEAEEWLDAIVYLPI